MSAPASDAAATRAEAKARAAEALALGELLACRAYLYELFRKLFGGEPDAELLDVLLGAVTADAVDAYAADDETMAALQRFLAGLAAREHRPVLLEEAHDEYMRLFIGPGTLPTLPWESPYRTVWSQSSSSVCPTIMCRCYARSRHGRPMRLSRPSARAI